eukprot:484903-Rhodomonas_salina.1
MNKVDPCTSTASVACHALNVKWYSTPAVSVPPGIYNRRLFGFKIRGETPFEANETCQKKVMFTAAHLDSSTSTRLLTSVLGEISTILSPSM